MKIHRMTPEQIITRISSTEHGCESCQWRNSTSNNGRYVCDASQPAYPNGSKATCPKWYKPRTKKGNGRGRAINPGVSG